MSLSRILIDLQHAKENASKPVEQTEKEMHGLSKAQLPAHLEDRAYSYRCRRLRLTSSSSSIRSSSSQRSALTPAIRPCLHSVLLSSLSFLGCIPAFAPGAYVTSASPKTHPSNKRGNIGWSSGR